jgi:hypothetical protein
VNLSCQQWRPFIGGRGSRRGVDRRPEHGRCQLKKGRGGRCFRRRAAACCGVLLARLRAAAWCGAEGASEGGGGWCPRSGRARASKETEGDGRGMAGHCGKDMGTSEVSLHCLQTVALILFDFCPERVRRNARKK